MIATKNELIAGARKYFRQNGVVVDADKNGLAGSDDMLAVEEEPLSWLVDRLLPNGAVCLLAGKAGVGKSVLARNLAVSVATGTPFLSRKSDAGTVIWVSAAEESQGTFKRHLRKLLPKGSPRLKYLLTLPDPKERSNWLFNVLEAERPSLLIVDTIVRFLDIVESTSYGIVSQATQPILDTCRRYDCAHIWLHHTNNAGGVHGGGTWERVPDLALLYSATIDGERSLRLVKGRDDITLPSTVIAYDSTTGRVNERGTRFDQDIARAEQAILDSGKFGSRETLAKCGIDMKAGRIALDNLVKRGLYVALSAGRITTYHPAESLQSGGTENVVPISSNVSLYYNRAHRTPPSDTDSTESTELTEATDSAEFPFEDEDDRV